MITKAYPETYQQWAVEWQSRWTANEARCELNLSAADFSRAVSEECAREERDLLRELAVHLGTGADVSAGEPNACLKACLANARLTFARR